MFKSNLKNRLKNGDLTIGAWITLGNSGIAEIVANAGFDWVVIDLEHSTISIEQAGELIRIIDLVGASPLVRLTSNDTNLIKRVMDAGAHGIVVPNVITAHDARIAVEATRYPPNGMRGVGLGRAQGYGSCFSDYLSWQIDNPVVIIQIEHHSALANLSEIFTTKGVDGFIIGPYDLSCSMGIPGKFELPEFVSAINLILQAGRKADCPAGLHIIEPDLAHLRRAIEEGYKILPYSVDIRMLDTAARVGISAFREAIK